MSVFTASAKDRKGDSSHLWAARLLPMRPGQVHTRSGPSLHILGCSEVLVPLVEETPHLHPAAMHQLVLVQLLHSAHSQVTAILASSSEAVHPVSSSPGDHLPIRVKAVQQNVGAIRISILASQETNRCCYNSPYAGDLSWLTVLPK